MPTGIFQKMHRFFNQKRASRNAYDRSQASNRDNQRKKNQKEAEGHSSASPVPGDSSRKR